MKKYIQILIWLGLLPALCMAQQQNRINSDQWTITDALGRRAIERAEAGPQRADKTVAMFYWTWHQGQDDTTYQIKILVKSFGSFPKRCAIIIIRLGVQRSQVIFIGKSRFWVIIKRRIPGYCASMPSC